MKRHIVLAILLFCIAGIGLYLTENFYPNKTFAFCAVVCPMGLGGVYLCRYIDKRYIKRKEPENPSY